jgi:hypothetical protein
LYPEGKTNLLGHNLTGFGIIAEGKIQNKLEYETPHLARKKDLPICLSKHT